MQLLVMTIASFSPFFARLNNSATILLCTDCFIHETDIVNGTWTENIFLYFVNGSR